MMTTYPHVKSRIYVGKSFGIANPKVDNMMQAYDHATYDHILISDSNVVLKKWELQNLIMSLKDGVGLVTTSIAAGGGLGFWGKLEELGLNTFYSRWIYLAHAARYPVVIGKCMLFRKSVLARAGGLNLLGNFLAEDQMAGQMIRQLGLKVALHPHPVRQNVGALSFRKYWNRHVRWLTIRKFQEPLAFFFEPLSSATVSVALSLLFLKTIETNVTQAVGWLAFSFWISDLAMQIAYGGVKSAAATVLWPLREILYLMQWASVLFGQSVEWRNSNIHVTSGGVINHLAQNTALR